MLVLALVPYHVDTAPGQRYRIEQWDPYLREDGIEITCAVCTPRICHRPPPERLLHAHDGGNAPGLARRVHDAWSASRYDLVFVEREACLIGPVWSERLARRRRPALVDDFDDAVYMRYVSPSNRYLSYLKSPSKTATLWRLLQ